MYSFADAGRFRNAKQYKEAEEIYDSLYKENPTTFGDWEIRHYANVCRKNNHFEKSLELCQLVIGRNPNFQPIFNEYYWNKYYTVLKVYPNEHSDDEIIEISELILNKFKDTHQLQFTPLTNTCLYMGEFYLKKDEFDKTVEWLTIIDERNLSSNSKFINETGNEITYRSQKTKYIFTLASAYFHLKDFERLKALCLSFLIEYPQNYILLSYLIESIKHIYNSKGENLIKILLSEIGFADDKIRDNYLFALFQNNLKVLEEWENDYANFDEWQKRKAILLIGKVIYIILNEKDIIFYDSINFQLDKISSSELGDYVFCPVSLVIKKSILIKENKSINTELNWENKKLISDFIKETNPDTLSLSNDFDIDVSELEYFKEILNSNLILSNKANINSRIFSSNSKYYFAAPDNLILLNKVSIIVEEKFRKATNDFAITEPFTNHIIETLNSITNIEDLKNNSAYIIYWIWTFENTFEEENKIKFKIKKAKIFKIIPNKESIELLHHYLNKLKNLYNNNSEEFSTKILSAKKCVACSVRDYCLHKTGRISTISFPYEKIELNKIIPILNNR